MACRLLTIDPSSLHPFPLIVSGFAASPDGRKGTGGTGVSRNGAQQSASTFCQRQSSGICESVINIPGKEYDTSGARAFDFNPGCLQEGLILSAVVLEARWWCLVQQSARGEHFPHRCLNFFRDTINLQWKNNSAMGLACTENSYFSLSHFVHQFFHRDHIMRRDHLQQQAGLRKGWR